MRIFSLILTVSLSVTTACYGHCPDSLRPEATANAEKKKALKLYYFGAGQADGDATMKDILGTKGANLAEMTELGLTVPPGFTISNHIIRTFATKERRLPEAVAALIYQEGIKKLEEKAEVFFGMRKEFGSSSSPLFLSVRSGAAESEPGKYLTVTKVGLHSSTLPAYARQIKDRRRACLDYIEHMADYARYVLGNNEICDLLFTIIDNSLFGGLNKTIDLSKIAPLSEAEEMVAKAERIFEEETQRSFPEPKQQLAEAVDAVIKSSYREVGAAVNVQAYVFGNVNDGKSGSGVVFSRNPLNGERGACGSFIFNAEGTDVVGSYGVVEREREIIEEDWRTPQGLNILRERMPDIYKELMKYAKFLESHFKEMQDIEFTIENGRLYILETRGNEAFSTPLARIRVLLDLVKEGKIREEEAVKRVKFSRYNPYRGTLTTTTGLEHLYWLKSYLEAPVIRKDFEKKPIASGVIILPGIVSAPIIIKYTDFYGLKGIVVLDRAWERLEFGSNVLTRALLKKAQGGVTAKGNFSDHIASAIRRTDRIIPYITAVGLGINEDEQTVTFEETGTIVNVESEIILDANNGKIYEGSLSPLDLEDSEITKVNKGLMAEEESELYPYYLTALKWLILLEIDNILKTGDTAELLGILKGTDILDRLSRKLIGDEKEVKAFKEKLRATIITAGAKRLKSALDKLGDGHKGDTLEHGNRIIFAIEGCA